MHKLAILALLLAALLAVPCAADDTADSWRNGSPLVCETYDLFLVTHEPVSSSYDGRTWFVTKIYFVRQYRIIADRHLNDDMRLNVEGKQFVLLWFDYGVHRRITAPRIVEVAVEEDIEADAQGAWWGAPQRRMSDLLPAPAEVAP